MSWQVGQKAVINRRNIVTVERVTKTGIIVADGRKFNVDGYERGEGRLWRDLYRIEILTAEIEAEIKAEMALSERAQNAAHDVINATSDAQSWVRSYLPTSMFSSRKKPSIEQVEKAEKIAATIRQLLDLEP